MAKRNNHRLGLGISIAVLVVAVIGIVLALFLIGNKETYVSETVVNPGTDALVCQVGAVEDGFFHEKAAQTELNKVKVLFVDEHTKQLFYTYDSDYGTEKDAKYYEAVLHAKYNKYLSQETVSQNKLVSTFAYVDKDVRIEVYIDADKMTRAYGTFFFVPEDEVKDFLNMDSRKMKKFYEEKGFSCIISN